MVLESAAMFDKAADLYERYIGRYSPALARALIAQAGVKPEDRVLDVGCGPGALTGQLIPIVGEHNVIAADPSEQFVAGFKERYPGVTVQVAYAETMPFPTASVDVALAQLVVHFMTDAHAGVAEMRRITRRGGTLGAATWDYADGMTLLRKFWDAAIATDPASELQDENRMRYCTEDSLGQLWRDSGLEDVIVKPADVSASYASFDDLWEPLAAGVGPAGSYVIDLDPDRRTRLKEEFRRRLDVRDAPFELSARAWLATGRNP